MKKVIVEKLARSVGEALTKALTPTELKMTVGFNDLTVTEKETSGDRNVSTKSKSINGEMTISINIVY